jgi:hypothetical protein
LKLLEWLTKTESRRQEKLASDVPYENIDRRAGAPGNAFYLHCSVGQEVSGEGVEEEEVQVSFDAYHRQYSFLSSAF